MSFKNAPAWVKKKLDAQNTVTSKMFLFPEGRTKISIDMQQEPETRNLGSGDKTVYSAEIKGKAEKFAPSKTLEKLILEQLMEGHTTLDIIRTGLLINNTTYKVEVVK